MTAAGPIMIAGFATAVWRSRFLHGKKLRQFQHWRARLSVAYAWRNSPFYRSYWEGEPMEEWWRLPKVDKRLMMANFDTFNTAGITGKDAMRVAIAGEESGDFMPSIDGHTVGLSSGTSGHRGMFLVTPEEQALWAGTILARTVHGLPYRRLRIAFFFRSDSRLYQQVGGRLIDFRYFDLMSPIERSVGQLNGLRPDVIVGPPSLLLLLAGAFERRELLARPLKLISVAEVLEPQDSERLTATFGRPVHQIYQCTEGLVGVTCRDGSLHLQEDILAVQLEAIGEGRYTPVMTDLWRRTQPIIRYQLNDVLRMKAGSCACGSDFRVIEAVEGRQDDLCYFPGSDGAQRPVFPDTIRRAILLADNRIHDFRAIQDSPGSIEILLDAGDGAFDEIASNVRASLTRAFDRYELRIVRLGISAGVPVEPPNAKRRRVRRAG